MEIEQNSLSQPALQSDALSRTPDSPLQRPDEAEIILRYPSIATTSSVLNRVRFQIVSLVLLISVLLTLATPSPLISVLATDSAPFEEQTPLPSTDHSSSPQTNPHPTAAATTAISFPQSKVEKLEGENDGATRSEGSEKLHRRQIGVVEDGFSVPSSSFLTLSTGEKEFKVEGGGMAPNSTGTVSREARSKDQLSSNEPSMSVSQKTSLVTTTMRSDGVSLSTLLEDENRRPEKSSASGEESMASNASNSPMASDEEARIALRSSRGMLPLVAPLSSLNLKPEAVEGKVGSNNATEVGNGEDIASSMGKIVHGSKVVEKQEVVQAAGRLDEGPPSASSADTTVRDAAMAAAAVADIGGPNSPPTNPSILWRFISFIVNKSLMLLKVCAVLSAIFMQLSPAGTIRQIERARSSGDLDGLPYVMLLFSACLWMLYGILKMDAIIMLPNITGLMLGGWYVRTFHVYCRNPWSRHCLYVYYRICIGAAAILCITTMVLGVSRSTFTIGLASAIFNVVSYGSPLSSLRVVIRDKSTACMPTEMSLGNFICSALWLTYGCVAGDWFIMIPNLLGAFVGSIQLGLLAAFPPPNARGFTSLSGMSCSGSSPDSAIGGKANGFPSAIDEDASSSRFQDVGTSVGYGGSYGTATVRSCGIVCDNDGDQVGPSEYSATRRISGEGIYGGKIGGNGGEIWNSVVTNTGCKNQSHLNHQFPPMHGLDQHCQSDSRSTAALTGCSRVAEPPSGLLCEDHPLSLMPSTSSSTIDDAHYYSPQHFSPTSQRPSVFGANSTGLPTHEMLIEDSRLIKVEATLLDEVYGLGIQPQERPANSAITIESAQ